MVWKVKEGLSSASISAGVLPLSARFTSQEWPVYAGSDDAKDRIRQAIDIVDLVGEQIQLRRQGRLFVGHCPWHDDSRPSLQVNPDRQTWKCWVCNLGGDVFSFVMQRESVDFRQALEMLSERAGVELRPQTARPAAPAGSPDDKNTLYRAMAWAGEQYHECLLNLPEATAARQYLAQRGISDESIQRYQLGFAPNDWQWLVQRAERPRFSPEVLQAVGLVLRSDRTGKWFDRFRGRVMFPIFDLQRRAIAVGGRILPELADEKAAKYINSPETRLFSKSEQLYGLHLARDVVSKLRDVAVMEGYTDVVVARQAGLEHAVAVLGTALGQRHVQVLRRFADRITLVLDGDEAGQRRASEILELFVANQVDVRIVTLPDGQDPCDFLLAHGCEPMLELMAQAPDAWDHKIQLELRDVDLVRDTHRANQALENLLATLAKAPRGTLSSAGAQGIRQQQILNRLARVFRLDEGQLRQRLDEQRQRTSPARRRVDTSVALVERPELEPLERDLFEILLQRPEAWEQVLEVVQATQLKSPTARRLLQMFAAIGQQGLTPDLSQLMLSCDDPQLKSLLVELDESGSRKANVDHELALRELLQTVVRRDTEARLLRQLAALESEPLDERQQMEMLQEMLRIKREIADH
jgi:DNA primase